VERVTEVLREHQWYDATSDHEDPAIGCIGCDDWFADENALDDGTFAAHQAAALSALIQEAQAGAWDEGTSFAAGDDTYYGDDNPYRPDKLEGK
jgi:hypothetical protein